MTFKEELEAELLEVIQDMKKIKYMHSHPDAINAKRLAYESRMEIIIRALELCSSEEQVEKKQQKVGVKVGRD